MPCVAPPIRPASAHGATRTRGRHGGCLPSPSIRLLHRTTPALGTSWRPSREAVACSRGRTPQPVHRASTRTRGLRRIRGFSRRRGTTESHPSSMRGLKPDPLRGSGPGELGGHLEDVASRVDFHAFHERQKASRRAECARCGPVARGDFDAQPPGLVLHRKSMWPSCGLPGQLVNRRRLSSRAVTITGPVHAPAMRIT
jgi:hypothetical protein